MVDISELIWFINQLITGGHHLVLTSIHPTKNLPSCIRWVQRLDAVRPRCGAACGEPKRCFSTFRNAAYMDGKTMENDGKTMENGKMMEKRWKMMENDGEIDGKLMEHDGKLMVHCGKFMGK